MPTQSEPPAHTARRDEGTSGASGGRGQRHPRSAAELGGRVDRARRPRARETSIAFRLAIGPGGIGLELSEPAEVACVRVTELSTSFPGIKFPVDVSGGVARFRHRRGRLEALGIEVPVRDLEKWVAPRLRGLLGTRTPNVWIGIGQSHAIVCVAASSAADDVAMLPRRTDLPKDEPVLAFDVHALIEGESLILVVANARGAQLPESPSALAVSCVDAALGSAARRVGAIFTLERPAARLSFALFPSVGARLPSTDGVRWTVLAADAGTWMLLAGRDAHGAAPTAAALRAREVAALLVHADDTLLRGDFDGARSLYLEALERTPRHAEIARRVVEIDARTPGRAEAALATLAEGRGSHDAGTGAAFVTGELLAQIGDREGAIAAFERAGESEPASALAARSFEMAARFSVDAGAAAGWLDRAVSLAPLSAAARWARVDARVSLGRLEDALADVEHLEALARGGAGKYGVWLRAGRAWDQHGLSAQAGAIFERALRYAPGEPRALAGLGVALLANGRAARGVSLLDRALQIAAARGEPEAAIRLELAKALAERLDDLPTAVAHASCIPMTATEAAVARGLEGRWRARLGDLTGASLAFARLRDLGASSFPPHAEGVANPHVEAVVELLVEGAAMEREQRRDPLAAQRHLTVALRLLPHHAPARRAFREVGAQLVRRASPQLPTGPAEIEDEAPGVDELDEPSEPSEAHRRIDLSLGEDPSTDPVAIKKSARVEELTGRLREDPSNDRVADELTTLLEELDRSHELVALLTGRLEDAPPERRAELAAHARAIFERMSKRSTAAGRSADAELYRDALGALPGE